MTLKNWTSDLNYDVKNYLSKYPTYFNNFYSLFQKRKEDFIKSKFGLCIIPDESYYQAVYSCLTSAGNNVYYISNVTESLIQLISDQVNTQNYTKTKGTSFNNAIIGIITQGAIENISSFLNIDIDFILSFCSYTSSDAVKYFSTIIKSNNIFEFSPKMFLDCLEYAGNIKGLGFTKLINNLSLSIEHGSTYINNSEKIDTSLLINNDIDDATVYYISKYFDYSNFEIILLFNLLTDLVKESYSSMPDDVKILFNNSSNISDIYNYTLKFIKIFLFYLPNIYIACDNDISKSSDTMFLAENIYAIFSNTENSNLFFSTIDSKPDEINYNGITDAAILFGLYISKLSKNYGNIVNSIITHYKASEHQKEYFIKENLTGYSISYKESDTTISEKLKYIVNVDGLVVIDTLCTDGGALKYILNKKDSSDKNYINQTNFTLSSDIDYSDNSTLQSEVEFGDYASIQNDLIYADINPITSSGSSVNINSLSDNADRTAIENPTYKYEKQLSSSLDDNLIQFVNTYKTTINYRKIYITDSYHQKVSFEYNTKLTPVIDTEGNITSYIGGYVTTTTNTGYKDLSGNYLVEMTSENTDTLYGKTYLKYNYISSISSVFTVSKYNNIYAYCPSTISASIVSYNLTGDWDFYKTWRSRNSNNNYIYHIEIINDVKDITDYISKVQIKVKNKFY